jgi:hypothetical protein
MDIKHGRSSVHWTSPRCAQESPPPPPSLSQPPSPPSLLLLWLLWLAEPRQDSPAQALASQRKGGRRWHQDGSSTHGPRPARTTKTGRRCRSVSAASGGHRSAASGGSRSPHCRHGGGEAQRTRWWSLPGAAAARDLRDHRPDLLALATSLRCCCWYQLLPGAAGLDSSAAGLDSIQPLPVTSPNLKLPDEVGIWGSGG